MTPPSVPHLKGKAASLEAMLADWRTLSDRDFLALGGVTALTCCPLAQWRRYIQAMGQERTSGSQYCASQCDAEQPRGCFGCDLANGDTEGCPRAGSCECGTAWGDDYWPERMALFRQWMYRRIEHEIADTKQTIRQIQSTAASGYYYEDARVGKVAPGRVYHNGIQNRP